MSGRLFVALGGLAGAIAVAMGAIAAHATASLDPAAQVSLRSAIDLNAWHALALVAVGAWLPRGGRLAVIAGAGFALGTLLFCGDVYVLVLGHVSLTPSAPIGGTILILSWLCCAASAATRARTPA